MKNRNKFFVKTRIQEYRYCLLLWQNSEFQHSKESAICFAVNLDGNGISQKKSNDLKNTLENCIAHKIPYIPLFIQPQEWQGSQKKQKCMTN
jgi:hypothetical protein